MAFSVGGWFTAFTVTVKVCVTMLLLAPPLFTVTVIVAVPELFATGVKLKLPVAVRAGVTHRRIRNQPRIARTGRHRQRLRRLPAPLLMPLKFTVCTPAFSFTLTLPIAFNVGGWFTAFTVTVKLCVTMLLLAPPLFTVTVIVAVP